LDKLGISLPHFQCYYSSTAFCLLISLRQFDQFYFAAVDVTGKYTAFFCFYQQQPFVNFKFGYMLILNITFK